MNATLSGLTIGSLTLDPEFDSEVTSYEAATTNATNKITAVPADEDAEIVITVGETEVENEGTATWEAGENTVTVKVTSSDEFASETKTYTVIVTKS